MGVGVCAHSSKPDEYSVGVLYNQSAPADEVVKLKEMALAVPNPSAVEIIFTPTTPAVAYSGPCA